MTARAFLYCVAAVVFAAMVAGIITVGGPFEGRREKFDQQRYRDLTSIAQALRCQNWRSSRPVLPVELTAESLKSHCAGLVPGKDKLLDDETGEPYEYLRKNDREFSICAKFYDAEKAMRLGYRRGADSSFDPATGCMTGLVK
jgi:hypothetical protein